MNTETAESSYKTATDILMFYINNANVEAGYALLKDGEVNLELTNKIGMTPLLVMIILIISKLLRMII